MAWRLYRICPLLFCGSLCILTCTLHGHIQICISMSWRCYPVKAFLSNVLPSPHMLSPLIGPQNVQIVVTYQGALTVYVMYPASVGYFSVILLNQIIYFFFLLVSLKLKILRLYVLLLPNQALPFDLFLTVLFLQIFPSVEKILPVIGQHIWLTY